MVKPLIAVLCVLALALAGCGSDDGAAAGTGEPQTADGILIEVTGDQLVLRTTAGEDMVFAVRPVDQRNLDLLHLQLHARDQLPSRVHYTPEDGTNYATQVDDL
ncbi:MAG TPA: hypothetical protein VN238_21695 [Solirubrobacteraceae bacterium]|nr:hypothetical protein [Solirubrobacteraceae bacterium]